MNNLSELVRGGTFCLSKAGLKVGNSDANDVDIAAPNGAGVDFCINGYVYHKADAADIAISATAVQAESTTCLYLVCLNSSGTLSTVKGTEVATADLTSGKATAKWPQPAADTCPIGGFKIVTGAGYTFTGGTTNFSATGITDTFYDFFAVPDKDIVS